MFSKNPFIIAEVGVNHNGSLDRALEMIDIAAECGADAVKFQTFDAARLATFSAPGAEYQKKNLNKSVSQYEMLKSLELPQDAYALLQARCEKRQVMFLSSPFDEISLELLLHLNVPAIKVPSGELTNGPLLLRMASAKCKVLLSTGMATLGEIEDALSVLAFGYLSRSTPSIDNFARAYSSDEAGRVLSDNVLLLHCTTEYPAPLDEINLHVLATYRQAFGLQVGYSDHTQGISVSLAAVALGATVIEKHFTTDKSLPGPDHLASLDPSEFRTLVQEARRVRLSLGTPIKTVTRAEWKNQQIARKAIYASRPIAKGERFSSANLVTKRPFNGVSPMRWWDLLDMSATKAYRADDPIEL